jgi:hypothetical protein
LGFVENYFSYFTEIEERFQQRRGTLLMLSTLDWALIESWKQAELPLEAVLRGIDNTFDKWEKRPQRRRINGLAFCTQEVLAAVAEMAEAATGSRRAPAEERGTGLPAEELAAYFERNAQKMESAQVPEAVRPLLAEDAAALRQLAAEVRATPPGTLEDLERRMTVMEEKLFALLLASSGDEELTAIRARAEHELGSCRGKMSGAQLDQLYRQYTNKTLLERCGLPRLSLFYL